MQSRDNSSHCFYYQTTTDHFMSELKAMQNNYLNEDATKGLYKKM